MIEPSQQLLSPIVVLCDHRYFDGSYMLVGATLPYLVETSNKESKTGVLAAVDLLNVRSLSAKLQSHVIGKLVSI